MQRTAMMNRVARTPKSRSSSTPGRIRDRLSPTVPRAADTPPAGTQEASLEDQHGSFAAMFTMLGQSADGERQSTTEVVELAEHLATSLVGPDSPLAVLAEAQKYRAVTERNAVDAYTAYTRSLLLARPVSSFSSTQFRTEPEDEETEPEPECEARESEHEHEHEHETEDAVEECESESEDDGPMETKDIFVITQQQQVAAQKLLGFVLNRSSEFDGLQLKDMIVDFFAQQLQQMLMTREEIEFDTLVQEFKDEYLRGVPINGGERQLLKGAFMKLANLEPAVRGDEDEPKLGPIAMEGCIEVFSLASPPVPQPAPKKKIASLLKKPKPKAIKHTAPCGRLSAMGEKTNTSANFGNAEGKPKKPKA